MKQRLKAALYRLAPRWTTAWMSERARAHSQQVVKEWGCLEINRKLIERFGSSVQEGPFQGMRLGPMSHAEHLGPYLLGVYESELDGVWEVVLGRDYAQILDVGAKFGYYAVGLARRYPRAEVVAFDTDRWARRATLEAAALNGTTHVRVEGFCDPEWLSAHLRAGALIVSDCEGYEGELLGSRPIPEIVTATLVVEVHEGFTPGVCERLRRVLGATHDVTEITSGTRRRESGLDLSFLSDRERSMASHEVRPPQTWFLAVPRATDPRDATCIQGGT